MRKSNAFAGQQENERRLLEGIRVADLVTVLSFREASMTVDVKPLVKRNTAEGYLSPPPVLGVKVAYIPMEIITEEGVVTAQPVIKQGDMGVIVYLDRDSDNTISTGAESQPNSDRLHSGDDAVFVGVLQPG